MTPATISLIFRFFDYGCNAHEISAYLEIEERDVARVIKLRGHSR